MLALAEGDVPPLASALIGPYLASARLLGQRTAELHLALASDPEDPRFAPEALHGLLPTRPDAVHPGFDDGGFPPLSRARLPDLPEAVRGEAQQVLALEAAVMAAAQTLAPAAECGPPYPHPR